MRVGCTDFGILECIFFSFTLGSPAGVGAEMTWFCWRREDREFSPNLLVCIGIRRFTLLDTRGFALATRGAKAAWASKAASGEQIGDAWPLPRIGSMGENYSIVRRTGLTHWLVDIPHCVSTQAVKSLLVATSPVKAQAFEQSRNNIGHFNVNVNPVCPIGQPVSGTGGKLWNYEGVNLKYVRTIAAVFQSPIPFQRQAEGTYFGWGWTSGQIFWHFGLRWLSGQASLHAQMAAPC